MIPPLMFATGMHEQLGRVPLGESSEASNVGSRALAQEAVMGFEDKVVIVTGAGSGIGLATARRFGGEGARVVIAEFDDARGKAVRRS